jgi:hypothetical protein
MQNALQESVVIRSGLIHAHITRPLEHGRPSDFLIESLRSEPKFLSEFRGSPRPATFGYLAPSEITDTIFVNRSTASRRLVETLARNKLLATDLRPKG